MQTLYNIQRIFLPPSLSLSLCRFDSPGQRSRKSKRGERNPPRIHCRSRTTVKMATMRGWILIEVARDMSWKISERENSRLTDNKCILLFLLRGDQLREEGKGKKKRKKEKGNRRRKNRLAVKIWTKEAKLNRRRGDKRRKERERERERDERNMVDRFSWFPDHEFNSRSSFCPFSHYVSIKRLLPPSLVGASRCANSEIRFSLDAFVVRCWLSTVVVWDRAK